MTSRSLCANNPFTAWRMIVREPISVKDEVKVSLLISVVKKIGSAASACLHCISAIRCSTIRFIYKEGFHSCRESGQWALARTEFHNAGVIGVVGLGLAVAAVAMLYKKGARGSDTSGQIATGGYNALSQVIEIPPNVKTTLNNFFQKSAQWDTLPVYQDTDFDTEKMNAPIMKGMLKGDRPFVAIRVISQSNEDNAIEDKKAIILYQMHRSDDPLYTTFAKNYWVQSNKDKNLPPQFFKSYFTDPTTGMGPTKGQEKGFQLLQELLEKRVGADLNGRVWKIV